MHTNTMAAKSYLDTGEKMKPFIIPKKKLIRYPGPDIRERMSAIKMRSIVTAIREHDLLGRGTNSVVDECFTDEEIIQELAREKIDTLSKALQYFAIWDGVELAEEDELEEDDEDEDKELAWWKAWDQYLQDDDNDKWDD